MELRLPLFWTTRLWTNDNHMFLLAVNPRYMMIAPSSWIAPPNCLDLRLADANMEFGAAPRSILVPSASHAYLATASNELETRRFTGTLSSPPKFKHFEFFHLTNAISSMPKPCTLAIVENILNILVPNLFKKSNVKICKHLYLLLQLSLSGCIEPCMKNWHRQKSSWMNFSTNAFADGWKLFVFAECQYRVWMRLGWAHGNENAHPLQKSFVSFYPCVQWTLWAKKRGLWMAMAYPHFGQNFVKSTSFSIVTAISFS